MRLQNQPVRFGIDQSAGPRDRRVVRRVLIQGHPQKAPDAEGVRRAPRDAALAVDSLEISNQEQAEIEARGQARAAHRGGVERMADFLDEFVKAAGVQNLLDLPWLHGDEDTLAVLA